MKLRAISILLLASLPAIAFADAPNAKATPSNYQGHLYTEGAGCGHSLYVIMQNLPPTDYSTGAEIVRIGIITLPSAHTQVGWMYTTRNGKQFLQTDSLHTLQGKLGNTQLGQLVADTKPLAYLSLTEDNVKALNDAGALYAYCSGTGK